MILATDRDKTGFHKAWPWWRCVLTGLILLALIMTAILSRHYLEGGSIAGCSGGSPCEQVLSSRWSMIAGVIPVSGLAMGVYLAMLVAGFCIGPAAEAPVRRLAWSVLLILAGSVAGSAVWFIIVQKWIIGDFCFHCMITHITGLLLTALIIWRAIKESDHPSANSSSKNQKRVSNRSSAAPERLIRPMTARVLTMGGLLLAGIMVILQSGFSPSSVYHDGESRGSMPVIDYHTAPVVGSPEAPYMVTLLYDYQCSHCQRIHFMLDEAIRRYSGKLAFVLCPTPLSSECNTYVRREVDAANPSCELAKIGLTVWKARPERFPAFENWMFSYESGNNWHPRSPEAARAKAIELVGQSDFDAAWADPWIETYLETSVQVFGQTIQNGMGAIPKLVFGSYWAIPEPRDADDLVYILQHSLGVPEP